jgi:hypothetical protein
MQFVPAERRGEGVPCHHIPLNEAGETVDLLEQAGGRERVDDAVKNWLRRRIAQIREERAETGISVP